MSIIKESIEGTKISVDISSSNITSASYDTTSKDLLVIFKNGSIYEYKNFPWAQFTKFRMSESQGKFFTTEIKNNYPYKKIK